jgi:hypothetical protein
MAYEFSTQRLHWTFTEAALSLKYAARHAASCARVASAAEAPPAGAPAHAGVKRPRAEEAAAGGGGGGGGADAPPKRVRGEDGGAGAPAGGGAQPYLTLAEEGALLEWASLALLRLCRCAALDRAVTATALVFLRRFYVAGLFVEYPPHEMMCVLRRGPTARAGPPPILTRKRATATQTPPRSTPAVFLAIKVEACPYTEFDELTRRRLAPMEAAWAAECEALLGGALGGGGDAPSGPAAAAAARAAPPPGAGADADPAYLRHEVPMLKGLSFHLTVYHGYRPLAALLRGAVAAAAGAGAAAEGGAPPHSAAWVAAWDGIQARAFAAVDAAALTDAPLLASPAHVALAALGVAVAGGACGGALSLAGAGGAHGGEAAGAPPLPLLPALAAPPDGALAAWAAGWLAARVGEAAAGEGVRAAAARLAALLAPPPPLQQPQRAAPECLLALQQARDQSLVPGTAAHGARLARLREAVAAYKAGKAERARAAAEALKALWKAENAEWGVASLAGAAP